jgi:cell division protein FtsB
MAQRFIPALLIALLAIFHAQLWFGRGSLANNATMRAQLAELGSANSAAKLANDQLSAEVRDLKEGLEMVEERARFELGMVRPNEIFVQYAK